jgi:hypothetical protein
METRLIALMMEAVSTSEPSVNFYQTARHNNPGDSHLHTRRRENLKSHKLYTNQEIKYHKANRLVMSQLNIFIEQTFA